MDMLKLFVVVATSLIIYLLVFLSRFGNLKMFIISSDFLVLWIKIFLNIYIFYEYSCNL